MVKSAFVVGLLTVFGWMMSTGTVSAAPAQPAVPAITAGPDLVDEARVADAPITAVTVFSDRARVHRRATLKLEAGAHALRMPDLPGATLVTTVRLECAGAEVMRVETTPVERERFSIAAVDAQIEKLERLTDAIADLDARTAVHNLELNFLRGVSPAAPVPEEKRVGKSQPRALPDVWLKVLSFLYERREGVQSKIREIEQQRRELIDALSVLQREVDQHNLGAFTDRRLQVLAVVQARRAGTVQLDLSYFVPGAAWWPSYALHFDPASKRVTLESAGLVQQASGEDWQDVTLTLSTAIPGAGIDMPELLTWTLGEQREFVPQARAAIMPAEAPRYPPPAARQTPGEADRSARRQVLLQRIADLKRLASLDARAVNMLTAFSQPAGAEIQLAGDGSGAGTIGSGALYTRMNAPPPPPRDRLRKYKKRAPRPSRAPRQYAAPTEAPAAAPVMPKAPEPVALDSEEVGGELVRAEGTNLQPTSLALFEPEYRPAAPRFSDASLPAVLAEGLDYEWTSPVPARVPSDGKRLQVPLASETFPVETIYQATPALKETAYLRAEVRNRNRRPILAGPVNIFSNRDFVGPGQLRTVGPGGTLSLPLGADEDIRLKRTIVPKTRTEGVFSKEDITDYTVRIEVANHKKRPVQVAITDQIPKSGHEDIEIARGAVSPRPERGPDADGLLVWKLNVPAGKKQIVEFVYSIKRPQNWQLGQ